MVSLGQYVAGEGLIYRLDPRIKLLSVMALSVAILQAGAVALALCTVFLFGTAFSSRLKPGDIGASLRPFWFFLALILLLHVAFGGPGHGAFSLPGLRQGMLVTWRFLCLIVAAFVLTRTTSPTELVRGFAGLLRPLERLRVPVKDLSFMLTMAFRFVPLLASETGRIRDAQRARGGDLAGATLRGKIKATRSLALTMVSGASMRVDEIAAAVAARGYHSGAGGPRRELHLGAADYGVLVLVTVLISFLLVL
ncbi:MAG: energy-coupling factor transporter transmembrane component T [Smithellaceae bacterium]|nr:energy-coupling factor transporter transmembrane component T [Smithellaceae bacterium]